MIGRVNAVSAGMVQPHAPLGAHAVRVDRSAPRTRLPPPTTSGAAHGRAGGAVPSARAYAVVRRTRRRGGAVRGAAVRAGWGRPGMVKKAIRPAIFKWRQTEPELICCAVRWYLQYSLSFRDVEELLSERGLEVDHMTIWRWGQRYGLDLEERLRRHLKPTNTSWRVDETYVRVRGRTPSCRQSTSLSPSAGSDASWQAAEAFRTTPRSTDSWCLVPADSNFLTRTLCSSICRLPPCAN